MGEQEGGDLFAAGDHALPLSTLPLPLPLAVEHLPHRLATSAQRLHRRGHVSGHLLITTTMMADSANARSGSSRDYTVWHQK